MADETSTNDADDSESSFGILGDLLDASKKVADVARDGVDALSGKGTDRDAPSDSKGRSTAGKTKPSDAGDGESSGGTFGIFDDMIDASKKVADVARDGVGVLSGKDTDGDGLPDIEEFARGTDRTESDTDQDGLFDKDEIDTGLDPKTAWSDPDIGRDNERLLLWGMETYERDHPDWDRDFDDPEFKSWFRQHRSDQRGPENQDWDGDGLTLAREEALGTDDYDVDSDDDGVDDATEYRRGTDPQRLDTDGDGFTDEFEIREGMDPRVRDADPAPVRTPEEDAEPDDFERTAFTESTPGAPLIDSTGGVGGIGDQEERSS